jgi:hypothetical protein
VSDASDHDAIVCDLSGAEPAVPGTVEIAAVVPLGLESTAMKETRVVVGYFAECENGFLIHLSETGRVQLTVNKETAVSNQLDRGMRGPRNEVL